MDSLLSAVLRLTRPQRVPTMQTLGDQSWVTTVVHAPLLHQLREATVGGIGGKGGAPAGGMDSSRLPFDPGALALQDEVAATLAAWLQHPPAARWPTERALVHWYRVHASAIRAQTIPPAQAVARSAKVHGWVDRITALFEPAEGFAIADTCPRCGQRWGIDPATGDQVDALQVTYRRPAPGTVDDIAARCRSCRTEWPGRHGLHVLQQEREDAARQPVNFDTPAHDDSRQSYPALTIGGA